MSIDKVLSQYKTEVELRAFAEAQQKTLMQVMKKNKELQEEVEHLKKLVAGAVPIIKSESGPDLIVSSDEEEIAKIELRKLKERSYTDVLTLEEAKRVEIYTKILNSRMSLKKDPLEREVKELDSSQLLAIAESNDSNIG